MSFCLYKTKQSAFPISFITDFHYRTLSYIHVMDHLMTVVFTKLAVVLYSWTNSLTEQFEYQNAIRVYGKQNPFTIVIGIILNTIHCLFMLLNSVPNIFITAFTLSHCSSWKFIYCPNVIFLWVLLIMLFLAVIPLFFMAQKCFFTLRTAICIVFMLLWIMSCLLPLIPFGYHCILLFLGSKYITVLSFHNNIIHV